MRYRYGLLLIVMLAHAAISQQVVPPLRVSIPLTELTYLRSSIVGVEYELSIALPFNYRSTNTNFPVLYATDANMDFAMVTQCARILQTPGVEELPPMIFVGIGYRIDSLSQFSRYRTRDLTPTVTTDPKPTGGAPLFLRFIREELMPFIKNKYRVSSDAGYFGFSLGGLFGLYTLFHEPSTFQHYIIGSPSIWYDDRVTLSYEEQYASQNADLPARVFMSVGGLEQDTVMVLNAKLLAEKLLGRHYPSLRLECKVFDGETHQSGVAVAFVRGLRETYKK